MLRRSLRLALLVLLGLFAGVVPGSASAASSSASFSYPLDGATSVDTGKPFAWSAVAGAQTYYLYVGTARGAKDLVDSGGISSTSYAVPPLPTNQVLWARIWTKLNDVWSYQDVSFTAAPVTTARFTNPLDGAQGVDPALPFSWYAVPNVQTYYLYVGTSKGAKDLVDSGGIDSTSYQVPKLPTGQTLWARIWTKLDNAWTYRDSSFTAAEPSRAAFTYPQNGSATVDTSKAFTWSAVPSGEAYYLYIGTSKGSSDLVGSGETQATSYDAPPLPTGKTLWARVWTKVNGGWSRYSDVSFQVSASASRLTYPKQGQTDVDSSSPFKWSAAPGAEGYYLWVGTSSGTSDLFNSGSMTGTSTNVPALPVGQKLHARLYTKLNGNWNTYTETTFTTAYSAAKLTYPDPRYAGVNQDMSKPFTWKGVPGSSGYSLWIGTSPGASDVLQTGLLSDSSYDVGSLPVGGKLWARVWTLSSGTWVNSGDVPFSPAARITAPAQQSTNVDRTQPVKWAPGAVLNDKQPTYQLKIGSNPGANDLYDSGTITTTSATVPPSAMPAGKPLYARVIVKLGDGTERRTDNTFATSDTTTAPAEIDWGDAASSDVDVSKPFAWKGTDLAQAYRLQILDGASTAADSGEIHVPRYFAQNLPTGTYTAKLGTKTDGTWQWTTTPFTVTNTGTNATNEIAAAHWATNYVRHMAGTDNYAYAWTGLFRSTNALGAPVFSLCGNYANELLDVLKQMNIAGQQTAAHQPRRLEVNFIANGYDGHVAVEFWNSADSAWIVLDPTFDIAMKRASDGKWATVADAHNATLNKNWSEIQYVPLGEYGTTIAKGYYLDYPLLYLNPPPTPLGAGLDPTPYLTRVNSWPTGTLGQYVVRSNENPVSLIVDGEPRTMPTDAVNGFGVSFQARSVQPPPGGSQAVDLFSLDRAVF